MNNSAELIRRFRKLSVPMQPIATGTKPRLKPLPDIRAVIYDFYGTLFLSGVGDIGIDDGASNATLFTEALNQSGINVTDKAAGSLGFRIYNEVVKAETNRLRHGDVQFPEPDIRNVWKEVLNRMKQQRLISADNTDDHAETLSVEFEARMNPVWPVDDLTETLSWFRERSFLQGIISNSQFYTPVVLEALTNRSISQLGFDKQLLHWSFEERVKKPELTFYEGFLKKMKRAYPSVKPSQILYAGNDMLKDIYPAASAGMKTALFAGDERSLKWRRNDSRCKNLEPDLVLTRLIQLTECVTP